MDQLKTVYNMFMETGAENMRQQDKTGKSVNNTRKADIIKTAKEMEALFAYQLFRIMRETSQALSEEKNGLGNETYMSMFDMEVSKLVSERGLGLHDTIADQLTRMINRNENIKR